MHSVKLLSAVVAFGAANLVAAQTCTEDIEITEPTPSIDCQVVDADITVDSEVAGDLSIEGPRQLKGNLIIRNATQLQSVSSTSINSIGGTFELASLELLNFVTLGSLESINELKMVTLPRLTAVTFGTEGVTEASLVTVTDTFLDDLSGLSLNSVESFVITNNRKLTMFESDLVNITDTLIVSDNGANMEITMNQLEYASEIQLGNVKTFIVPKLETVDASIKFDKCPELESFTANNLTSVENAISFINNKKLANISLPALTKIGGDLTVLNNTALEELDGFPELETVSGAIDLGGDFEKVELPALKDVKGSVKVSSTTDIADFCKGFEDAKSSGAIQGEQKCTSNNEKANEGGADGGDEGSGNEDAAGIISVNTALLGLVAFAGIAQLL